MSFERLINVVYSQSMDAWEERNRDALDDLFGKRYAQRAEKCVKLRAPDMKGGGDEGVPYAAYIHPSNPNVGPFGGLCFVVFPVEGAPCLVEMGVGTNGLAPDEAVLGRPGHARKMRAVCEWLNHSFGHGRVVAWAKQDPTRIDVAVPDTIQRAWPAYDRVFKKYGKFMHAVYRPTEDRAATEQAIAAMLDVMFEERGEVPLAAYKEESGFIRSKWFAHLMPETARSDVVQLLKQRRYVVLQGPPGTGKTRMAGMILAEDYAGFGRSIQFHPNTTYENFIGGLAPAVAQGDGALGFTFVPTPGFLMEAASAALADPLKPYLLHIDEINRADLGKVLGEGVYLLEPEPDRPREISLAYDFGAPFGRTLRLPENLHILGTMNTADRSIAIVDVAVRRRFAFQSMWPSLGAVKENGCTLTEEAYTTLVSIFVEHAPDDAFDLVPGHSYFLERDPERAKRNLETSLGPLLREYLAQGYVAGFAEPIRSYLQWLDSR